MSNDSKMFRLYQDFSSMIPSDTPINKRNDTKRKFLTNAIESGFRFEKEDFKKILENFSSMLDHSFYTKAVESKNISACQSWENASNIRPYIFGGNRVAMQPSQEFCVVTGLPCTVMSIREDAIKFGHYPPVKYPWHQNHISDIQFELDRQKFKASEKSLQKFCEDFPVLFRNGIAQIIDELKKEFPEPFFEKLKGNLVSMKWFFNIVEDDDLLKILITDKLVFDSKKMIIFLQDKPFADENHLNEVLYHLKENWKSNFEILSKIDDSELFNEAAKKTKWNQLNSYRSFYLSLHMRENFYPKLDLLKMVELCSNLMREPEVQGLSKKFLDSEVIPSRNMLWLAMQNQDYRLGLDGKKTLSYLENARPFMNEITPLLLFSILESGVLIDVAEIKKTIPKFTDHFELLKYCLDVSARSPGNGRLTTQFLKDIIPEETMNQFELMAKSFGLGNLIKSPEFLPGLIDTLKETEEVSMEDVDLSMDMSSLMSIGKS